MQRKKISDDEQRELDRTAYAKYKDNNHIKRIDNDGYCLYAISAEWISHWRDFINRKGERPGPVTNRAIAEKIYNKRKLNGYKIYDNNIKLKDE